MRDGYDFRPRSSIAIEILMGLLWLPWQIIRLVFGFLKMITVDVAKGIYGRVVQRLSWLGYLALAGFIATILTQ